MRLLHMSGNTAATDVKLSEIVIAVAHLQSIVSEKLPIITKKRRAELLKNSKISKMPANSLISQPSCKNDAIDAASDELINYNSQSIEKASLFHLSNKDQDLVVDDLIAYTDSNNRLLNIHADHSQLSIIQHIANGSYQEVDDDMVLYCKAKSTLMENYENPVSFPDLDTHLKKYLDQILRAPYLIQDDCGNSLFVTESFKTIAFEKQTYTVFRFLESVFISMFKKYVNEMHGKTPESIQSLRECMAIHPYLIKLADNGTSVLKVKGVRILAIYARKLDNGSWDYHVSEPKIAIDSRITMREGSRVCITPKFICENLVFSDVVRFFSPNLPSWLKFTNGILFGNVPLAAAGEVSLVICGVYR